MHQLLHVWGITGPSTQSAQLHNTIEANEARNM